MVAYQDFVALSQSRDSAERGQAAHLAALAYLNHFGPADEHAALYAALVGFLDDPSVRVRGALAYGLLHTLDAPRPIMLALLRDSQIIARAVAQYSPVLVDADLLQVLRGGDPVLLRAIAEREHLSRRVAEALVGCGDAEVRLGVLRRSEPALAGDVLRGLAVVADAELRGVLLDRSDLPPDARLMLVEAAVSALRDMRLVSGSIVPERLDSLLRNGLDTATTSIGEVEVAVGNSGYAGRLIDSAQISPRTLLHALVHGHVLFFADCVAELSGVSRDKVFTLLDRGSRAALNAAFARCGLDEPLRNLLARILVLARTIDLADDPAGRHYVVTAVTEELIAEHAGNIPAELDEAFAYLSEQDMLLARAAARGVMDGYAGGTDAALPVPTIDNDERLALPAA